MLWQQCGFQPRRIEFDSLHLCQTLSNSARLECFLYTEEVVGSIPTSTTNYGGWVCMEWTPALQVGQQSGSIPESSTTLSYATSIAPRQKGHGVGESPAMVI